MEKRVFLIVLDSFGIGGAPDAAAFGDEGDLEFVSEAQGERLASKTTAQDQYIESGHFGNSARGAIL